MNFLAGGFYNAFWDALARLCLLGNRIHAPVGQTINLLLAVQLTRMIEICRQTKVCCNMPWALCFVLCAVISVILESKQVSS